MAPNSPGSPEEAASADGAKAAPALEEYPGGRKHEPRPPQQAASMQSLRGAIGKDVHMCTYVSDMDRNGMLHYVGTNHGRSLWSNPSSKGYMTVLASSCAHGETQDIVSYACVDIP